MIRSWQIPQRYMSIARYMEIEIPVSRIQVNNRLIDSVTVEVIRTDDLGLWLEIGRTQAGYHYSITYAVPTGGGCGGPMSTRQEPRTRPTLCWAGCARQPGATGSHAMTVPRPA